MDTRDTIRDSIAPAPEKYAQRAHFHGRAADAVTRKLQKMFALSDADIALPATLPGGNIRDELGASHCTEYWTRKSDAALHGLALSPESTEQINDAARHMMLRYAEAFYVRKRVCPEGAGQELSPRKAVEPYTSYVTKIHPQWRMCDIISNHLCLQTEAQLCSMGLDERTAHRLNGAIIATANIAFSKCAQDMDCARVTPQLGSTGNDADLAKRQHTMRTEWRDTRNALDQQFKNFTRG